jgi:hypothetical protein
VYEDEGQHLQSVYPTARAYGGPGRFALDPGSRLVEDSSLVTPDAGRRLIDAWSPYWDLSKPVLLEKSPPNLVRMRFLRALFPRARFIVVTRHPVAVAMATRKWTRATMGSLVFNWVSGHRHLSDDAAVVGGVALVRYEDLMSDPKTELDRLFAFLSLEPHDASCQVQTGLNEAYFSEFIARSRSWRRWYYARLSRRYEQDVMPFGYSLLEPRELHPPAPRLALLRPPARDGAADRTA